MLSFVIRRFIPSFGAAMVVAGAGAAAQDHASATYGDTTISIGGGAQFLKLPDVRFTFLSSERDGRALTKQKNSILDDYGGAASGSGALAPRSASAVGLRLSRIKAAIFSASPIGALAPMCGA